MTGELRRLEAEAPALSRSEFRLVMAGLVLAMILSALDLSMVNTALPRIASNLGGLDRISWVVTAFMLGATISAPLYGKLSDMYGRRRMFVISISITLSASVLCGISQTMLQLILFRALQGLGSGGLLVLSQSIIADLAIPRERGRYLGIVTGAMTVSCVAGPLIGGALTTTLSWRWIFFVNLPVGSLALTLILMGLKAEFRAPKGHEIDVVGAALLAASAICLLLILSLGGSTIAWASPQAAILGLAAIAGFIFFYFWEKRATEPLVDLELLRTPGLLTASLASSTISFSMMGMNVFVPLYFQLVLGLDPTTAGLMLTPQIGAMLVSSLLLGPLSSHYGRPKLTLMAGTGLQVSALAALTGLAFANAGIGGFLLALAVFGLGQGIAMPSATMIVQAVAGAQRMGTATATITFIRSLGGATGVAVSGGVVAAVIKARLDFLPRHEAATIRIGVDNVKDLAAPLHSALAEVYRVAITSTFAMSTAVMILALFIISAIRDTVLPDHN